MLPRLNPRKHDAHKGDFGHALLIGGSRGMGGAICLAGRACLRSGAGLTTLAVPSGVQALVAAQQPDYMTFGLPEDTAGCIRWDDPEERKTFLAFCEKATAIALGPGLGQSTDLEQFASELYRNAPQPLVIDADGLNALAKRPQILNQHAGPRILTPHPGEFGRLTSATGFPGHDQISQAVRFAEVFDCVVILKGHRSLITNGEQSEINQTGNPGMAKGGSGDVLTGIITAFLCQGMAPFAAAHLAAHVHGLAGDLAAAEMGQISLLPSDLVNFLPKVCKNF
jgi:NAD(P)H-hydrate epimerase